MTTNDDLGQNDSDNERSRGAQPKAANREIDKRKGDDSDQDRYYYRSRQEERVNQCRERRTIGCRIIRRLDSFDERRWSCGPRLEQPDPPEIDNLLVAAEGHSLQESKDAL
jgi:hypothetical protein